MRWGTPPTSHFSLPASQSTSAEERPSEQMPTLCACYLIAIWLLSDCCDRYVLAIWLLSGCYLIPIWLLFLSDCCLIAVIAM